MARHVLIRTHAALERARAVGRGNTRSVVLYDQGQSLARTCALVTAGREAYPAAAPLAGVVEQVPDELREVAAITDEQCCGRDRELERQILARVHLQQRAAQFGRHLRDLHRRLPEQCPAGSGGTLQLVLDDAGHAVELRSTLLKV